MLLLKVLVSIMIERKMRTSRRRYCSARGYNFMHVNWLSYIYIYIYDGFSEKSCKDVSVRATRGAVVLLV